MYLHHWFSAQSRFSRCCHRGITPSSMIIGSACGSLVSSVMISLRKKPARLFPVCSREQAETDHHRQGASTVRLMYSRHPTQSDGVPRPRVVSRECVMQWRQFGRRLGRGCRGPHPPGFDHGHQLQPDMGYRLARGWAGPSPSNPRNAGHRP